MQPPYPCPTRRWHDDTYDAISPLRPELSAAGKTVIITGAGGVIGRQTALAFAEAGARRVALVGRTEASLQETASLLPGVSTVHVADVCSQKDMEGVAAAVGTWDVLVMNAGYAPKPAPIAEADIDDFWGCFETNTKPVVVAAKALVPRANRRRAVVLSSVTGVMAFPPKMTLGMSAYMTAKMAQVKLIEYLAAENDGIFAACVHPGIVDSPVYRAAGMPPGAVPMDSARLPAHFFVWMASSEANDLRGKTAWANWDVEELKVVASKLRDTAALSLGVSGFPFTEDMA